MKLIGSGWAAFLPVGLVHHVSQPNPCTVLNLILAHGDSKKEERASKSVFYRWSCWKQLKNCARLISYKGKAAKMLYCHPIAPIFTISAVNFAKECISPFRVCLSLWLSVSSHCSSYYWLITKSDSPVIPVNRGNPILIPRGEGLGFFLNTTWSILAGTQRNMLLLPFPKTISKFVCTTESSSESSMKMRDGERESMKRVGRGLCLTGYTYVFLQGSVPVIIIMGCLGLILSSCSSSETPDLCFFEQLKSTVPIIIIGQPTFVG